jgi:uracil-DNA glycosylase
MKTDVTECIWYPLCPMRRYYEGGHLEASWVDRYCKKDWNRCVRYQMESEGTPHPDWMLPDGRLDERLRQL